ncbi:hypothetical protein DTL42_23580 [Bremerella cremea]|uniref:Tetratricopeptide repeat protein n=1 Tax=Bremerella cremea TaxID=1031537 RepID=A0A368KL84_9BACT|nr:tetratricopeptide repeat protein [Bremerella cremea]RCS41531.1 hypothetical protein DTL42_23580 [Bremerella cremea]
MSSSNSPESQPLPPRESPPPARRSRPIGRWLLTIFVLLVVYLGFTFLNTKSRAQWKWAEALQALEQGQITEAQQFADQALELAPDDPAMQLYAAELSYRIDAPENANEHLKRALELAGESPYVLNTSSFLLARMGRHDQSLPLADKVVELAETKHTIHRHTALNQRAYAIALAAEDGQASPEQIKQGLIDINEALAIFVHDDMVIDQRIANYLDTRGYLELFAGAPKQGLEDINKAIAVYELLRQKLLAQTKKDEKLDQLPETVVAEDKELKNVLAVLYSHRAAIYEKLNQPEAAAADRARAKDFGLNRKKGIW